MSDSLPDTPLEVELKCPGCIEDFDPRLNEAWWCEAHRPSVFGESDRLVSSSQYLSGSGEAEGGSNKRWCDFFHRRETSYDSTG